MSAPDPIAPEPCDCLSTGRIWCCMPDRHTQETIAPDALREAVAQLLASWDQTMGGEQIPWAQWTEESRDHFRRDADAVLAVVAKHRDEYTEQVQQRALDQEQRFTAEMERLRGEAVRVEQAESRIIDILEAERNVAQDRIARARYALLTVTGKSEALAILEGRDG